MRSLTSGVLAALLGACSPGPSIAGDPGADGLVFVRIVDGSGELMRARLSDGAVLQVTQTPDREEAWPYWSPAAERLIFQVTEPGEPNTSDLVLWNPKTDKETQLSDTPRRDERWPVWSPDGTRIAYAFRGGRIPAGIALVDLARRGRDVIARSGPRDFFFRPSFDPEGTRLVAQRRSASGKGSKLWILRPGEEPRVLTGKASLFDMKPWFTRDGERILYSRRPTSGGPREIISVRPDGSEEQALIRGAADDHSARPSPSRDEFAFVSDRDGSMDVFLADLSGDGERRLTHTPDANEFAPRWSPDGERLVLTVSPSSLTEPLLADRTSLTKTRVVVLDRGGKVLFETPGLMPDWMAPWP